ncbi:MAG: hypothetical protein AB7G06_07585 [Bdellovibrionales bacterium]
MADDLTAKGLSISRARTGGGFPKDYDYYLRQKKIAMRNMLTFIGVSGASTALLGLAFFKSEFVGDQFAEILKPIAGVSTLANGTSVWLFAHQAINAHRGMLVAARRENKKPWYLIPAGAALWKGL